MIENLKLIFDTLASATETIKVFKGILKGKRGDTRALLEEIKENAGLCWLVVEKGIAPEKIIKELSTKEYDRLLRTDFNFNSLKHKCIANYKEIKNTELATYSGKSTETLLINIYDKIKDIKRIYRVDKNAAGIRWGVRVINLQKRNLLLLRHLSGR